MTRPSKKCLTVDTTYSDVESLMGRTTLEYYFCLPSVICLSAWTLSRAAMKTSCWVVRPPEPEPRAAPPEAPAGLAPAEAELSLAAPWPEEVPSAFAALVVRVARAWPATSTLEISMLKSWPSSWRSASFCSVTNYSRASISMTSSASKRMLRISPSSASFCSPLDERVLISSEMPSVSPRTLR